MRHFRSCAVLAAGALGLHQLRYSLAYGGDAGHELRAQGHAYLGPVTAAVVAVLILTLSVGLHRLASGVVSVAPRRRLLRIWAGAAGALLVIFAAQESVEGALTPGHPSGLAALVGHGGLVVVPLAAAIGLAIALALRGVGTAAAAARGVARRLSPRLSIRAPLAIVSGPSPALLRLPVLAGAAAGRAPPRTS
jgi:hypothetical protein